MKAEPYHLINEHVLNMAIMRLREIPLDGKTKLVISNAGDRSVRQNALYWLWNTFVANSGMGSYDTKETVHLAAKMRWAIPILIRDDENFASLYSVWKQLYGSDTERMEWFADMQVSTAIFTTHQMAEYLTDYQRFYLDHGVSLPIPEDRKLLEFNNAA